jgi:hypothetical protein
MSLIATESAREGILEGLVGSYRCPVSFYLDTMYNSSEADVLFKRLDLELMENIDSQYFSETREFR